MHPNRSKEAFAALIEDWQGILVSDGYGVSQGWVQNRQTCLAHLIRTARGLSENATRIWRLVASGRSQSYRPYATWPKRRLPVASGAPGRHGFAT